MADGGVEDLRRALRKRAAEAAAATLEKGGSVAQEEIDSIRNLSYLCATLESTVPKKGNRWFPAALFLLALICTSILLFRRIGTTQVEVNVTATSAIFRLSQTRYLTDSLVVTSLRLSGIRKLSDTLCVGRPGGNAPRDLTLTARNGSITLQPIEMRKGVSITATGAESAAHWAFAFAGAPQTIKVTLEGSLRIDGEPCEAEFPHTLEATLNENSSLMVFELARAPRQLFSPLLPVDRLAFVRTDFVELAGSVEQQQSSTLMGGSIYLEELEGKEIKLRDGEWLEIGVRHGWLQPPRGGGADLRWRYRGLVDALRSGPADSRRDLKPSWLEYARAQHGIELLWGTALSLFGLGGTLMRWFKA